MYFRRPLAWIVLVGLASCGPGPEGTEQEPSPLPAEVVSVGTVEEELTVTNTGAAVYDSTLRAPKCSTVGALCDTGALVKGRGPVGPETNAPNTLFDSCQDGTYGTYQVDESLEALKVSTADGTNFAPGKTVHIDAQVWPYASYDLNALDLYYAPNANSPVWTFIATVRPTTSGLQTLRASYTLPTGTLQAIRGVFRSGSTGTCSTGAFDDRDDLVFAVGSGSSDTTKPTTSLSSPAAGATLTGTVTVSASASDNVGVTKVEFYAGSTRIGTDTTAPYSISWNTTGVANGTYSLTSRAYDAAGNVGVSAARSVTVSNTGGACSVTEQLLLNPGFESGNVNWTATQGVIANATTARTGSWRALMGGKGFVGSYLMEQQLTIPSTACSATLKFWLNITTSEEPGAGAWDTLVVQLLDGQGLLLETLATYSNQNVSNGYVERSFNLAAYKGRTLRISISADEDAFYQTSFLVDDTSLTITR